MTETPEQWAKRMHEITQRTPQFCFEALIKRYEERGTNFGGFVAYGPFSEEELNEYDIDHGAEISGEQWIFFFDLNSTHEEMIKGFKRFIQYRKKARTSKTSERSPTNTVAGD